MLGVARGWALASYPEECRNIPSRAVGVTADLMQVIEGHFTECCGHPCNDLVSHPVCLRGEGEG